MQKKIFARPLLDHTAIETFLVGCLSMGKNYGCRTGQTFTADNIVKMIRDAESAVGQTMQDPTFSSTRNRVPKYREDAAREELREIVLTELITKDRLDDDEKITLGTGGAKPKQSVPLADLKAYFVIGLPASGKSTLINEIADKLGAMILDSDFAKRKLPEFDNTPAGANLVHKESSTIIWGNEEDRPSLFEYCKTLGLNVVVPTIGQDYADLNAKCDLFIAAGYSVHLTTTTLSRESATIRALERFLTTGRYVPLGLIFDAYANDPLLNYYRIRVESFEKANSKWASFGAISTSTSPVTISDCTNDSNPANLLRSA